MSRNQSVVLEHPTELPAEVGTKRKRIEDQMTLLIFFRSSLLALTLGIAIFVALKMPQGPFQPLRANNIRDRVFGAVRSMAAHLP